MPVYNSEGNYYDQPSKTADDWNVAGFIANPIAKMNYRRGQNLSKNHTLFANVYLELQPLKDLRFRSSFGYRMSASSYRQYVPIYDLSTTTTNPTDDISQNQSVGFSYTLDNTLSYVFNMGDDHG